MTLDECVRNWVMHRKDTKESFDQPLHTRLIRAVEKPLISELLAETDWNISEVARILGFDRMALHRRVKLYNLARPAKKVPVVHPANVFIADAR